MMDELEAIEVLERIRRNIGTPALFTKTGEAISMAIIALRREHDRKEQEGEDSSFYRYLI